MLSDLSVEFTSDSCGKGVNYVGK